MGKTTEIAWCDHTFNPWIGCTKVSAGCANCYAAALNHRWGNDNWGPGKLRRVTSASNWKQPLQWAKDAAKAGVRRSVFCASLADVFDVEAPRLARLQLWNLIGETFYALDWLLVTKRPERIQEVMLDDGLNLGFFELCRCWLLTTVENQEQTKRIPHLLGVDAAVHGVSVEPMLSAVDLTPYLYICHEDEYEERGITIANPDQHIADEMNAAGGLPMHDPWVSGLDWVICGGESGPKARPCDAAWLRSILQQCQKARVPCFVKQLGGHPVFDAAEWAHWPHVDGALWDNDIKRWEIPLVNGKGADPTEWPSNLQVREFPEVKRGM